MSGQGAVVVVHRGEGFTPKERGQRSRPDTLRVYSAFTSTSAVATYRFTTRHQRSLPKCYTPSSLLSLAEDSSNAEKEVGCPAVCCGHGKIQSCLSGWISVETAVTAVSAAAGYGSCRRQAPPREFFQHIHTHYS